jgi:GNAT superfamily N-acetyltransferase
VITVREATISDVDTIYDLVIAIAKHHNQEEHVVTDKDELAKSGFGNNQSFGVLLAEFNDEIAGYCSFTWNYSIWLGSSYMNIDDVFVWEKYRGQQAGEKLMLKAKEVCLAKGAARIKWEVERDKHAAIRFYKRLGANIDIKGLFRWDVAS